MMRTYKGRPSVVLREIHGSYFLIDTTARVEHDTSVIYQLDPMGAFIWRELANAPTLDGLVKAVQTACMDAPGYAVLQKDVAEFLEVLEEKGFLTDE